jgi:4-hydroxy-L-threonine phosphate dehydrogenase PdxA
MVDAVLTMCHDQGHIAMKLMGFDRGVDVTGQLATQFQYSRRYY